MGMADEPVLEGRAYTMGDKAIMPELPLGVPFVFVHKGHGLDNGGMKQWRDEALDVNAGRSAGGEPG